MRTYVLVHGGGHGGWCYRYVERILHENGHNVYSPTMTGLAERAHLMRPDIDLNFHINDIVKVLEFEDLWNVVLVGHSYGGMVITGVADRATDRIGHIVYLDAANPKNGESLVDVAPAAMKAARGGVRVVDGIELTLFPGNDPLHFYGVKDPKQIEWMRTKLTPHPWKCFEQKLQLQNETAMRKIPESHIVCKSSLPTRNVEELKASSHGRFWDIDTGHDLMITEPEKVAKLLLEIAAI